VKTVAEYRLYAEDCRRLAAKTARPQDKQALETIARAWDQVADEREDRATVYSSSPAQLSGGSLNAR
jgi:hypothetical protein